MLKNPDVASSGMDPWWHYYLHGRAEGRLPNNRATHYFGLRRVLFDPSFYLAEYHDIKETGTDPLWHFVTYGRREGRMPSKLVKRLVITFAVPIICIRTIFCRPLGFWPIHAKTALVEAALAGRRNRLRIEVLLLDHVAKFWTKLFNAQIMPIVDVANAQRPWLSILNIADSEPFSLVDHEVIGRTQPRLVRELSSPSEWVATVREAKICGAFQVVANNEYVHFEPAADPAHDFVAGQYRYVTKIKNAAEVLVCFEDATPFRLEEAILLSGRCSPNYYHWLIEYLGRAASIYAVFGEPSIPLIVDGAMYPQEFESLRVIFPQANLHHFKVGGVLEVGTLHIPSVPTFLPDTLHIPLWKSGITRKNALDFLRARVLSHLERSSVRKAGGCRRVYLTRRTGRMVQNNQEVEELLENLGLEIVDPGVLSFEEQVVLFADAQLIVGPLGAAFANLIFASPGCKVLGLTSPYASMFPMQARLADYAGCSFTMLPGIQAGFTPGDEDHPEERPLSTFMGLYAIDLAILERVTRGLLNSIDGRDTATETSKVQDEK